MDIAFLLASADAFRRCAEAPGAQVAERAYWADLAEQARHLFVAAQDGPTRVEYAAVNDAGRVIGERHHRAKLSDEDIALIHALAAEGMSHAQIAAKFDDAVPVSRAQVGHILSGRRRSQTTMGHRLITRSAEPVFWPAHPDEFEIVVH